MEIVMGDGAHKGLKNKIFAKAATDPGFRAALLKDAKGTLSKEFGLKLPADHKITFHESEQKDVHVVLPPAGNLTDDELSAVAGGRLGAWSCSCGPSIG
jgi:hypothetical protein